MSSKWANGHYRVPPFIYYVLFQILHLVVGIHPLACGIAHVACSSNINCWRCAEILDAEYLEYMVVVFSYQDLLLSISALVWDAILSTQHLTFCNYFPVFNNQPLLR